MPIDIEKVLGAEVPGADFSWTEKDIILYNLAVGAGDPPTDLNELRYTYEGDLVALPGFGTIPPFAMMMSLTSMDGADINLAQILHGEQSLTVHGPIPTSGSVSQAGRVSDVFDKGKGALIVLEVVSTLERDGQILFTNRAGVYVRGEGGFGGDPGPGSRPKAPDRQPDHIVETPTIPQQALLYRQASGDRNPLHADPGFAAFAGYERPILHGLCTYGMAAKVAVDTVLDGDPGQFEGLTARFSGHVFPGETLVTRIWEDGDGHLLEVSTKERGLPVLSNARLS
ncbi:MAG: MaoC/PaaZ C-terminal domain-containing protein [Acidimicrobiia bacterium]